MESSRDEFEVYYQPIRDVVRCRKSRRLIGAACMRTSRQPQHRGCPNATLERFPAEVNLFVQMGIP